MIHCPLWWEVKSKTKSYWCSFSLKCCEAFWWCFRMRFLPTELVAAVKAGEARKVAAPRETEPRHVQAKLTCLGWGWEVHGTWVDGFIAGRRCLVIGLFLVGVGESCVCISKKRSGEDRGLWGTVQVKSFPLGTCRSCYHMIIVFGYTKVHKSKTTQYRRKLKNIYNSEHSTN